MSIIYKQDIFENSIIDDFSKITEKNNVINPLLYKKYHVKRGLRNENGTGVLVGLTGVGNVHGYKISKGNRIPDEGKLTYRGIDVKEIVNACNEEKRFGFEEVIYLLLFGELPSRNQLSIFEKIIGECRELPEDFTEDMILKFPSNNIMNKLQRTILAAYSFDTNPEDISTKNLLRQSMELIARVPTMIAHAYQAKIHYYDKKSLVIHSPRKDLSTAENILYMIRPDNKYSKIEAEILDLALIIHAEHGGGNNSAFATHVVSSTGTDTYSAIAAAVGSLKGPKHGGANIKVIDMMKNIKLNVNAWDNKKEIRRYLLKILKKEAFDHSGLIYGMGHAVYTLSDPRSVLLKKKALELAKEKQRVDEFILYKNIEEVSKEIFKEIRGYDAITANVDLYSGFVYDMLNIPSDLYTPIFAVARTPGWCAHRIEQILSEFKIIRPAYMNIKKEEKYTSLNKR
ncbi:citrate/2-methylcitrate synthase [Clostridium botulinum]|uniref:Citrate synthase n=1 Tax=Clostridium botulinum TaxID=1491 RepID=A0A9Q1ZE81_CLOBO|nr:citrate/2-methylcitrate synthase [Clostridium botulinum]AEB76650.1 citrate synthase I [Clostridium botulinum BKT015925]KEI02935.1 citrate synthase [Clostridium botulinum D str. 16868]KEI03056.1 citrate synthase [Clostridium botulinum C/D str. Sp77]KLU76174.1 citrate synthase [Clostridium botulinum V891]KOA73066.1 citrate synthase [Clostridium botulinum]